MTFFSQDVEDPTMVADGRSFFRGFYRRLGVVYAKVEEIQEMMPIHPSFQHKAIKVHMHLYLSMVKVPPWARSAPARLLCLHNPDPNPITLTL